MTRAELERALRRLRDAGRLTYVRGRWCRQEAPDDWREVLTAAEGRELCGSALAYTACRPGNVITLEATGVQLGPRRQP